MTCTHADWFSSASGVRQGGNLSPTLFALFINDLAKEVKNTNRGKSIDRRHEYVS
jgi:hypothetical protein